MDEETVQMRSQDLKQELKQSSLAEESSNNSVPDVVSQHFRQKSSLSSTGSSSSSGRSSSLDLIHDDPKENSNPAKQHHLSGNPVSTPNSRKRLSLNFTPLPVISSSGSRSNGSPARDSRELDRDSPGHHFTGNGHSAASSISPDIRTGANSGASTVETYLSELAARERKVVELRDELKRVEESLRRAEIDLRRFRDEASMALASPRRTKTQHESRARRTLSLASVPVVPPSLANPVGSIQGSVQTNISGASITSLAAPSATPSLSSSSLSSAPSSVSSSVTPLVPPPPPAVSSPTFSSPMSQQSYPRSRYSFEKDHERSQSSITGRFPKPQLPPKEDVFNMGKRVVEELGTQFWGLFEDIKNVTIGEEARDSFADERPGNHESSHSGHSRRHSNQSNLADHPSQGASHQSTHTRQPTQSSQPHQRRQRSASNSYYIL